MENPESFEIEEDLRQSREYANYMESIGWHILQIPNPKSQIPNKSQAPNSKIQIFIKSLGPIAIAKLQRNKWEIPLSEVEKILKANRVMMCKIEPLENNQGSMFNVQYFKNHYYRLSSWPLLGTKTLRVDLRPSEQEIFNSFKKDCRYTLRKIQDSRFKIQENRYNTFYEIWKKSAKRKSLWIPKEKEYQNLIDAFGKNVFCLTVEDLAGAVILIHEKTAFYYYAGSTLEGTKLNLPYLVVWEAMKKAKKNGCKIWDFEGIYDTRWPNKGWMGFSHFKKSFGGREIEFPGSFEKWRWPF